MKKIDELNISPKLKFFAIWVCIIIQRLNQSVKCFVFVNYGTVSSNIMSNGYLK